MSFRLRTCVVAVLVVAGAVPGARADSTVPTATPRATCGAGSLPETGAQGRVPDSDRQSGRAAQGYTCNTKLIGHTGVSGGFRTHRYVDPAGHECAYYDTTALFPFDYLAKRVAGVAVLDMTDPTHPVQTATLVTPAMLTPHESLSINAKRGLLAADMGNPFTYPGVVDLYDIAHDCRHPVLKSTTPVGVLGHEGSFAPDGNTFYVTSIAGMITAVDVTNPSLPVPMWISTAYRPHGVNVSDDGNRLYMADIRNANATAGLTILDVSEIQRRVPNPQVRVVSKISWPDVSVPQTALPITIAGHRYLFEVDEFARNVYLGRYNPADPVGASRIIDIADDAHPKVVSNVRLEVNLPAARTGDQRNDVGASTALGGYAAHYCAVPREVDPGIVACSFILSGLRIFDIRDPLHPKELAYFNRPITTNTSPFVLSAPSFAPDRGEVWYADGNAGFYVVKLTNGVWPFPAGAPPAKASPAAPRPQVRSFARADKPGPPLPATGARPALVPVAVLLAGALGLRRRRRRIAA